jgi:nitrilase
VRVGCSICYDVRFGELYRALAGAGAQLLVVPAAFTLQTGKDHWEVLMRARAIETGCYVAAAAQVGSFPHGKEQRACWGHSMVVDPWGKILVQVTDRPGFATARIDLGYLGRVREMIPVHQHRVLKG